MSLDTPDYTPWFRERPVHTKVYNKAGAIPALTDEVVFDLPRHDLTLTRCVIGTDTTGVAVEIRSYNEEGDLEPAMQIPRVTGTEKMPVAVSSLYIETSEIFDLLVNDVVNDYYKFALNRKLRFGHGCRLRIRNTNPTPQNRAYEVIILDRGIIP